MNSQNNNAEHPLAGLKLNSFAEILDKLPPLDMMKVQKLLKKQRERFPLPVSANPIISDPQPLLLVSHDFKGNYRPSDFSTVCSPSSASSSLCPPDECFTMELGWKACDIFNYFSHTRISIPPPEWTATCRNMSSGNHPRRKKIIGTIITEWNEGFRECNDYLLSSQAVDDRKLNQIILRLAALCVEHDFDGYLVNIENPIHDTTKMKKFVQLLNDTVTGMLGKDRGLVIWYDSVILPSGELRWQNTLNRNNSAFFESCSGIFTNYNWTENHAVDALEVLADLNNNNNNNNNNSKSASHVAKRSFSSSSVFFGTDCFGRGTFLGGGHDSHKAVGVAMSLGLSAALFAPGWTMENFNHAELGAKMLSSSASSSALALSSWKSSRLSYLMVSTKFWQDVLQQICDNSSPGSRDEFSSWNLDSFSSTSFCASAGCVFSVFGSSNSESSWCQLSALEQQPSFKIPVVPSISSSSSSAVILFEHFTSQDAQKYGCFWGNRSLVVNMKSSPSTPIELCSVSSRTGGSTSSSSIVIELVVPKSTMFQELNARKLTLCASLGNQENNSAKASPFSVIDDSFDAEAKSIFLGETHSVISCTLENINQKDGKSTLAIFISLRSETANNENIPPPPSLSNDESSMVQIKIGLIRIFATEDVPKQNLLFSTTAMKAGDDETKKSLFAISRRQRNDDEKGAREVIQIAATDELMNNFVTNDLERISVLGKGKKFLGNIFVAGVWLKCEIDSEDNSNHEGTMMAMVLKNKNGSFKYCAL